MYSDFIRLFTIRYDCSVAVVVGVVVGVVVVSAVVVVRERTVSRCCWLHGGRNASWQA